MKGPTVLLLSKHCGVSSGDLNVTQLTEEKRQTPVLEGFILNESLFTRYPEPPGITGADVILLGAAQPRDARYNASTFWRAHGVIRRNLRLEFRLGST